MIGADDRRTANANSVGRGPILEARRDILKRLARGIDLAEIELADATSVTIHRDLKLRAGRVQRDG